MADIEGLRSPQELITRIYEDTQTILSKRERAKVGILQLLTKLGGTHIGQITLPEISIHWKTLLQTLIDDIMAGDDGEVVFFWDELPLFLYNVAENCSATAAMETLDVLRSLRQQHRRLRMVFTGSVGIHQVIGSLRRSGYANDPTNDMLTVEVPPLTPLDGAHLSNLLLAGERIELLDDIQKVSTEISAAASHIPFYIHSLVARIRNSGLPLSSAHVQDFVDKLFSDPDDPAHFSYYCERLKTYYPDPELPLSILDSLAHSRKPMSLEGISNLIRHQADVKEEKIRETLTLLQKDHYLWRLPDKTFDFRYGIVRGWWEANRV